MAWDSTVSTTVADSYMVASSTQAGSAAESAASRKIVKYNDLAQDVFFQPISFESLGTASSSTASFFSELGHRISLVSREKKEETFCGKGYRSVCKDIMRFCCTSPLLS